MVVLAQNHGEWKEFCFEAKYWPHLPMMSVVIQDNSERGDGVMVTM